MDVYKKAIRKGIFSNRLDCIGNKKGIYECIKKYSVSNCYDFIALYTVWNLYPLPFTSNIYTC